MGAAIGFGTSLSGVVGGLSSFANGPATTTTADTSPVKLNRAVAELASRAEANDASVPAGSNGGGGTTIVGDNVGDNVTGGGTTTGGGSGGTGGTTDSTGSTGSTGSSGGSTPTVSAPDVDLPSTDGGGTAGQTVDNTVDTVGGVLDGVSNTVNGLLGQ